MIRLSIILALYIVSVAAHAIDSNVTSFEYGNLFREIILQSEYLYQPKILNFHSEKSHFLNGTMVYVPKDKSKVNCAGNAVEECEIYLVTSAHGVNGKYKLPEVIIADVDSFVNIKIQKEFSTLSSDEKIKKKTELKKEIEIELKTLKHPNVFYEDGKIKAVVRKENIFSDAINDVGIIKLGPILNYVAGEYIEYPRYRKFSDAVSIEMAGNIPNPYDCILGRPCTYKPQGVRKTMLTVVPMSYLDDKTMPAQYNSYGSSYLLSPLKSDKIIPFRSKTEIKDINQYDKWSPKSSLISRQITFDARSTYGNSGGLIMQYPKGALKLSVTGLLKGHNNYVNESSAVHPTHIYNLIEATRDNSRSKLNKCRGEDIKYEYDPNTKVTYRVVGNGLISEYLNDKIVLSESVDNSGESGNNSGESGNNSGESGNNSGESGNNSGESGNNSGESGNNSGESGDNSGESAYNYEEGAFYSQCNNPTELLQIHKMTSLVRDVLKVTKPTPGLSYKGKPVIGFWMKSGKTDVPVFANEEFINLYCQTDLKFEPMINPSLKDLFYERLKKEKKDSIESEICYPSYKGEECLNISKKENSNILSIKLGASKLQLDLDKLTHENFQYWFPIKNDQNRVTNLVDLRQLFFVDAGKVKVKGINAEETGSSVLPDSFALKDLSPKNSGQIKDAFVEDFKGNPRLHVSSVFQNNNDGFTSMFQKILGDSPIEVSFKGKSND